ncbi:HprK-related kinase A [Denitromonas iodatirespirans]|uniref:HprK-related kinase A n=1 Tax=Denitromonas iodatirespirans TaxID=2795389 RepID=A0A944DGK0_DENI1|nr:HprK-related kinase A [Denitromonas iodatirespirans]MBT0963928.1 HprK-related kinase A [Denitromonas iodatirespirans]
MNLSHLSNADLAHRLKRSGVRLRTGPFVFSIRSPLPEIRAGLQLLHAQTPLADDDEFVDYHIAINAGRHVRRWLRPQACFEVDGVEPFKPLPRAQALAMLEWGMNWCITAYGHHQLVIHAAAVAHGDRAAILPAPPGSGKSTLCAALVNRGWRLLSDELTLVSLETGEIQALARPVNLKNASIQIMRDFAPQAVFGPTIQDTSKGAVALMQAPASSVAQAGTPARPTWIVLPKYAPGTEAALTPMAQGEAFLSLADNAMNYHILGEQGFHAIGRLIDDCPSYRFTYSHLDDAIATFDALADAR